MFIKGEKEHSLFNIFPNLVTEWHSTKNGNIKPDMIKSKSNRKFWWRCEKGHVWESSVNNRAAGKGCPYCSRKFVCVDNCLQTLNPELSKQWHPIKNGDLTPKDITVNSRKKAWWKCDEGHEWEAIVGSRTTGRGCPYCSGNRVCNENCLKTLNPKLAEEWHKIKNRALTPNDFTLGSNKKAWWICKEGHEWEAVIASRAMGCGCPICASTKGKKSLVKNLIKQKGSLSDNNPNLAKQWHPTKNGDLTASDVTVSSGRKVWWQCEKGHEWEAIIANRAKGSGCPTCYRMKIKN